MTQNVKPVFLFAGGRHSRGKEPNFPLEAVFREYGINAPTVAYSGTASGDDRGFFGFISAEIIAAGAGKVVHAVIAPEGSDLKKATAILESADIVFISGGDVGAGMDVLREKQMIDFLTGLYRQGKPFFGMSAGAIMLAEKWVRWRDPEDENSAELFDCLGFAPVICDMHDEQGGWEELKAALRLEKEGVRGFGLAAGSAGKVTADGKGELVGGTGYQYVRKGNKVVEIDGVLPPVK